MLVLPAPAKLNLYLHITGKRDDGYHLLDTVFQLIDLQDTVTLAARTDGAVVLHTPIEGLPDVQHLAVRAAHLLKTHTGSGLGADIWVEKRIPSGAGLGGGSSDAATTLMGLNQLWQCGLSPEQLQTLGLLLGADVPFFCSGLGTARALGIGEILTDIPTPSKHFIVLYPNCHVATPTVFKHASLKWLARDGAAVEAGVAVFTHFSHAFAAGLSNDLQEAAQHIAPPISRAIECLSHLSSSEGVRMSGSGSAVFAQFATLGCAQSATQALTPTNSRFEKDWTFWTASALNQHPAHAVLSAQ